jgi:hypothetical protein
MIGHKLLYDVVDSFFDGRSVPGSGVPSRMSWPEIFFRSWIDDGGGGRIPGNWGSSGRSLLDMVPREVEVPIVDVDTKFKGILEEEDDEAIRQVDEECDECQAEVGFSKERDDDAVCQVSDEGQICEATVKKHSTLISVNEGSQHLYRATSSHLRRF